MTDKRKKRAEIKMKERKKKEEKAKKKGREIFDVPQSSDHRDQEIEGTSTRNKTSNVYRPYSTFHPVLPQCPTYWHNRDLRVMAPEGLGYWSSVDQKGRKTSQYLPRDTARL
jgi:hypothetical protein